MDAQGLEGARRGMDREARRRGTERLDDDLGELRRARHRTRSHDGARDAARLALLAIAEDDVGQHLLGRGC